MLDSIKIKENLDCLVIVGPTSVGKSKLAVEMAKKYNGEVISGDAYQVYRKMDIGTAKVTTDEMDGVAHHLIDICNYDEEYNVSMFQRDCRNLIEDIKNRGKLPIIAGGTGLYIQAVLYKYEFNEDPKYLKLKKIMEAKTIEELQKIVKVNHVVLNHSDRKNHRRLATLATKLQLGLSINADAVEPFYDNFEVIGLTMNRDKLYERINARVDTMFDNGLVNEVKQFKSGFISQQGIGYKEVHMFLNNEISLKDAKLMVQKNSRNFAKRQFTWYNNKMDIEWLEVK